MLESVDALLSHIGGTKGKVSNITYQSLNAFFLSDGQGQCRTEETAPRDFWLQAFFHKPSSSGLLNIPFVPFCIFTNCAKVCEGARVSLTLVVNWGKGQFFHILFRLLGFSYTCRLIFFICISFWITLKWCILKYIGPGEDDLWKNWSKKFRDAVPLNTGTTYSERLLLRTDTGSWPCSRRTFLEFPFHSTGTMWRIRLKSWKISHWTTANGRRWKVSNFHSRFL